ncbi:alpha/beta hydrolase [Streptomyces sp. LBUM 1486]|nr:alpha/beta hydrolase [Streptomyces sp. LBUM 1485]MBP5914957.1 alpha/beta hydrolase [Streptomyces sp. LBUM 1486]QTU55644.1 alpha/beta hydrolase [Streptomyces sp. LBUM 1480]
MRRRRLMPLLAVSVTATLVPALATSTATAAPAAFPAATSLSTASASTAAGALDPYVKQKPKWKRCDADAPAKFKCATIKVPLDYRAPGGKRIDLAISRLRSTAPDKRHGVLFSNPGGPGGSGLFMPLGVQEILPKAAQRKYDLIGFDPRGVGRSSPVSCGLKPKEEDWLRPYKKKTFAKDVAWARTVADKCEKKAGATLRHITTRNTVRDMDLIRAILGEKKISYLGYSYGTYLGAVYTQLFPGRADRFVLDSAVEPARAWRGMIQWWAEGAEPAFDRWTEWAAARSATYGLGDTPEKVDRTFWGLVAQAGEKPIEVDGQAVSGDDIRSGMRGAVFSPDYASDIMMELKKAAAGKPASAKKLAVFAGSERSEAAGAVAAAKVPADNEMASFWAVVCGDNSAAWSRDPESYRRDAIADKRRYPLFGDFASSIKPCAFWDKSAERATKVNNKVGSLVVQNEWDSQTPLPSGQALHADLLGSRMVTVHGGEGHGVYPSGNACSDGAVNGYLITGKLPAKDVTCEADKGSSEEARKNRQRDVLPGSPLPERAPDRF